MTATAIIKKFTIPLLTLFAIGGLLIASGQADALFNLTRNNLKATGTVVDISTDYFTVDTGGTEPPFDIQVTDRTRFHDGLEELDDLEVGDDVEVRARVEDGGVFEGRRVELLGDSGYGYGGGCDRLRVRNGEVVSFSLTQIVVEREGIEITAEVNDDTRIRGYRGNRVPDPGDIVDLRGDDCGGDFIAERITIRRP